MLQALGVAADEATSGEECLRLLLKPRECGCVYKLLIIDVNMPMKSGIEVRLARITI